MAYGYVLYNTKAGRVKGVDDVSALKSTVKCDLKFIEISSIESYAAFFEKLGEDDFVVLVGGDGTINRFANDTRNLDFKNKVFYYPMGTGNDFARDIGYTGDAPVEITKYLKNLPSIEVKGKDYLFINGVGYGIDGYCCEEGDKLRKKSDKPVNYTAIAIKGLLFHYKPTGATVTVDGETHTYRYVWLTPVMKGRYYGGGMIPTPNQRREDENISVMVYHAKSKLRALIIFPSIFKGEHVKKTKVVDVFSGKDISVEFDRPAPLQIDGETILGVTSYKATAHKKAARV